MQTRLVLASFVALVGCGTKASDTNPPSLPSSPEGSAPAKPPAVDGAVAAATTPDAVVVAAGSGSAVVKAPTDCLPSGAQLGRFGSDLAVCGDVADVNTCWTVDPKTGKHTPRKAAPFPGVGLSVPKAQLTKPHCYQELCWTQPTTTDSYMGDRVLVAFHPDGKRAAILEEPNVVVFDLATKKATATFAPKLGNTPSGLWFAGEFVMVRGSDAGPYSLLAMHKPNGKYVGKFDGLFEGDVGIAEDGHIIVEEESVSTVTVITGKSIKGKKLRRKIPKGPCTEAPGMDPDSTDPKEQACLKHIKKHYEPYSGAILVDYGSDFIGSRGGELFVLDGKTLAEKSRIKLATCPEAPGN